MMSDDDYPPVANRIAAALELIAERIDSPNEELLTRVAALEDLLNEFVAIMESPISSDKEWTQLLYDTKKALGIKVDDGVEV